MVVVDANTLIGLAKGDVFDVLSALFLDVRVPADVIDEVVRRGAGLPGAHETDEARKTWLTVEPMYKINHAAIHTLKKSADRAVVAVAENLGADFIISDDKPVRRVAGLLGIDVLATIDVLLLGKRDGHIASCRTVMDKMDKAGFGIAPTVYAATIQRAGE